MTPLFRIFLLLLTHASLSSSSWSQTATTASDLGTKNLSDLKQIADKLVGGSDAAAFTQAAFASKRLDFLEVCWATRPCNGWFLEQLEESTDREFRDRLVLMMLRCPEPRAWPDHAVMLGGQVVLASIMRELMRDHLPDLPPTYDIISSLERRRSLADKLETIIKEKHEQAAKPAPASVPMTSPPQPQPQVAAEPVPKPVSVPKPTAPSSESAPPGSEFSSNQTLWICAGAVILLITVFALRRKAG